MTDEPKHWEKWEKALNALIPEDKVRETARACVAADSQGRSFETWRTYLMRYRRAETIPKEEQARIVAKALRIPRKRLPPSATPQGRLATLEGEVVFLKEWVTRGFESLGVEPALQDEARRVANGDDSP